LKWLFKAQQTTWLKKSASISHIIEQRLQRYDLLRLSSTKLPIHTLPVRHRTSSQQLIELAPNNFVAK
jgi:hypothetical protein